MEVLPITFEVARNLASWRAEVQGKATTNRVEAQGLKWQPDGKFSKHIPCNWSGPQPS